VVFKGGVGFYRTGNEVGIGEEFSDIVVGNGW
jgi:hypothetical protein